MCTIPHLTAGKYSYVVRTTEYHYRTGSNYNHDDEKHPNANNRRGTRDGGGDFRKVGGFNETCLSQSCSKKSLE